MFFDRSSMQRPKALLTAIVAGLSLVACSDEPATETTTSHLAAKLELTSGQSPGQLPGWEVVRAEDSSWVEVRQAFTQAQCIPSGIPGVQAFPIPLARGGWTTAAASTATQPEFEGAAPSLLGPDSTQANRLFQDGKELSPIAWHDDLDISTVLKPGTFAVVVGVLYLIPFETSAAPGETGAAFEFVAHFPSSRESEEAGSHHLVDLGPHAYHGISLFTGDEYKTTVRYEKGAELLLGTAARGAPTKAVAFEVLLDGIVIWSKDLATSFDFGARESWRIELPPGTSGMDQVLTIRTPSLSTESPKNPGLVHVVTPIITQPSRLDSPQDKTDIVLFMADTFRADNLAKGGGNPRIAPHVNDFVDEALYFASAWSPASWTLPSQASLLSGLSPTRHGAVIDLLALDDRIVTLPELLNQAGYRTVAITEGGFMDPTFGLAQGFEAFIVGTPLDIEATLASVKRVLGDDDGRPLFLYVQTFRAHSDYISSETALAELPELFGEAPDPAAWDFTHIVAEITSRHGDGALKSDHDNGRLKPAVIADPDLDNLFRLYRGGAYDTSAGFGRFLDLLDQAGLGDVPTIFTSDHGEAFGEHAVIGHANNCFDETLRIPLAIRAPGAKPRVSAAPVTLLDLGPTICELADIGVPELWEGRSLVELFESDADAQLERRLISFECPSDASLLPAEFAVHQGDYKLIGHLDAKGGIVPGSLVGYDLKNDPLETQPVDGDSPMFAPLTDGLAEEIAAMQVRLYPPTRVNLSSEDAERLNAMGYLGDD